MLSLYGQLVLDIRPRCWLRMLVFDSSTFSTLSQHLCRYPALPDHDSMNNLSLYVNVSFVIVLTGQKATIHHYIHAMTTGAVDPSLSLSPGGVGPRYTIDHWSDTNRPWYKKKLGQKRMRKKMRYNFWALMYVWPFIFFISFFSINSIIRHTGVLIHYNLVLF